MCFSERLTLLCRCTHTSRVRLLCVKREVCTLLSTERSSLRVRCSLLLQAGVHLLFLHWIRVRRADSILRLFVVTSWRSFFTQCSDTLLYISGTRWALLSLFTWVIETLISYIIYTRGAFNHDAADDSLTSSLIFIRSLCKARLDSLTTSVTLHHFLFPFPHTSPTHRHPSLRCRWEKRMFSVLGVLPCWDKRKTCTGTYGCFCLFGCLLGFRLESSGACATVAGVCRAVKTLWSFLLSSFQAGYPQDFSHRQLPWSV